METNETLLLTVKEAARQLRVSPTTLWMMEGDGRLKPVDLSKPGAKRRTLRYSVESLREFARGQQL